MPRQFWLDLARSGVRFPIGTDLVLHEHADAESIRNRGSALGQVLAAAARRWNIPMAMPLMDLRLEKADLAAAFGLSFEQSETWRLETAPEPSTIAHVADPIRAFAVENRAQQQSLRWIASNTTLLPVGMAIGPFSLMTKLLADPITPVALAGNGITAGGDESVGLVERALHLAEAAIHRSIRAQMSSGARAVMICEPAANTTFLSPRQLRAGATTFERYVLDPNLRLKTFLDSHQMDLIFHDCGELLPEMVEAFAHRIHPAVLSLGSSRRLWEDAALVPDDVVLYGNLPTKTFYSDDAMPVSRVQEISRDLLARMTATGRLHILGSECDVLHVPDAAATIRRKVEAMLAV
jgi:uroporphyrinogen-III decarboxylase